MPSALPLVDRNCREKALETANHGTQIQMRKKLKILIVSLVMVQVSGLDEINENGLVIALSRPHFYSTSGHVSIDVGTF